MSIFMTMGLEEQQNKRVDQLDTFFGGTFKHLIGLFVLHTLLVFTLKMMSYNLHFNTVLVILKRKAMRLYERASYCDEILGNDLTDHRRRRVLQQQDMMSMKRGAIQLFMMHLPITFTDNDFSLPCESIKELYSDAI